MGRYGPGFRTGVSGLWPVEMDRATLGGLLPGAPIVPRIENRQGFQYGHENPSAHRHMSNKPQERHKKPRRESVIDK
jgi:hypothetical protein